MRPNPYTTSGRPGGLASGIRRPTPGLSCRRRPGLAAGMTGATGPGSHGCLPDRRQLRTSFRSCPRGDSNTETGEISPDRGNHAIRVTGAGRTRPGIPRRVRYLVRYLACTWLCGRRGHLLPHRWLQRPRVLGSWAARAGRATFHDELGDVLARHRSAGEHLRRCRQAVACRAGCPGVRRSETSAHSRKISTSCGRIFMHETEYSLMLSRHYRRLP